MPEAFRPTFSSPAANFCSLVRFFYRSATRLQSLSNHATLSEKDTLCHKRILSVDQTPLSNNDPTAESRYFTPPLYHMYTVRIWGASFDSG